MVARNRWMWSLGLATVATCLVPIVVETAVGQGVVRESAPAAEAVQVVIEREPLVLTPPETYKVPLHLDPIKSVDVAAQVDGIVGAVLGKMGEPISAQAEVVRLDSRDRQLELERAKAALEAARAAMTGAGQTEKEALVKVAQVDVELAQYRLDLAVVRAPFDGVVQRVHVVDGQFVRAGEPLATIVDVTQLQVEVPVDRNQVTAGAALPIQVERQSASATVQGVLPLTAPFEPLRELFESVATGIAVLDNKSGGFQAGQTVYASMIPRLPVAEVPNGAIGNTVEGTRRVQVIRDGFVRNVGVELLGAIGEERTVVTGRFSSGDELVLKSSEELLDGTQVVPRTHLEAPPATGGGGTTGGGTTPRPGGPPKPGGF